MHLVRATLSDSFLSYSSPGRNTETSHWCIRVEFELEMLEVSLIVTSESELDWGKRRFAENPRNVGGVLRPYGMEAFNVAEY
jgi:hypothetical protein